ncbi:hypothetical protein NA57DRAFT_51710 [Rhizodiscina lignyota]|uniref:Protection of telomeres protein 1 n=1 Tax=Rhizodiscina lignyota TaxID=1504668 RepID=A0A9P4IT86_9PEZI|nr:hypothetical protein NA57DRAFT_51710 [Rhizodiscina lignyota]
MPPPAGYYDLQRVQDSKEAQVSVMGVVVSFAPPMKSQGTDLTMTFTLRDPMSYDASGILQGLNVRFFRPNKDALPKITDVGDVISLRKMKMTSYNGVPFLLSTIRTEAVVFPRDAIPDPLYMPVYSTGTTRIEHRLSLGTYVITVAEQVYAIALREWTLQNQGIFPPNVPAAPTGPAVAPTGPARREKFSLLQAVEDSKFYDVVAEVVKEFPTSLGKDIYITDYTQNPKFYNYPVPDASTDDTHGVPGDEYNYIGAAKRNWPGPFGQHVLCVTLFYPHTNANVKVDDIVYIRNLHIKLGNNSQHLEGRLHQDKGRPEQIDIYSINRPGINKINDYRAGTLRSRKSSYWEKLAAEGYQWAKSQMDEHEAKFQKKKMDKAEKKREKAEKKRERKEKKAREAREKEGKLAQYSSRAEAKPSMATEGAVNMGTMPLRIQGPSNPRVKCGHHDKPLVRVHDILHNPNRTATEKDGETFELPFINMNCRSFVRVVDFWPPAIEDFASSIDDPAFNNVSKLNNSSQISTELDMELSQSNRWEWSFRLLVEDAHPNPGATTPEYMQLLIAGETADYLLKLDAADLRRDKDTLGKLKELLWTLWGDVGELKDKHKDHFNPAVTRPSNLPFYCCIQEYGVVDMQSPLVTKPYKRMHRIAFTTINT